MHTDSNWRKSELDVIDVSLKLLTEVCVNCTANGEISPVQNDSNPWDFTSALFLSMTILTTLGNMQYRINFNSLMGTYSSMNHCNTICRLRSFCSHTVAGKVFCIFYGFFGIPFTGVVLASNSDYFSRYICTNTSMYST